MTHEAKSSTPTARHFQPGMRPQVVGIRNPTALMVIPLLGFGIHQVEEGGGRHRRTKKQQGALGFIKDGIGTVPEIVAAKITRG